MSDKTVYAWKPLDFGEIWGMGGGAPGKDISTSLFRQGLPVEIAYKQWFAQEGVQAGLKGEHRLGQDFTEEVKRTIHWFEQRYPLAYGVCYTKKQIDNLDVLWLDFFHIFVNQRVLDVLETVCPADYEAFPIEIENRSLKKNHHFYWINITHLIHDALDKRLCKYHAPSFMEEGEKDFIMDFQTLLLKPGCMKNHCLGRLYENLGTIMVSKTLVDALIEADIKGLEYIPLEDSVNKCFTTNYESDGMTLKY